MYTAAFLDHFQNPRHQGTLATATHRGHAEDAACGDRLWLDLEIRKGTIVDVRFRVQGCVGAIAAGSATAIRLSGQPARPEALTREAIAALLGEVPRAKRHALGLAIRTYSAALGSAPV